MSGPLSTTHISFSHQESWNPDYEYTMNEPEKDEKGKGKGKYDEPTNGKDFENEKDDNEEEDGAAGAW